MRSVYLSVREHISGTDAWTDLHEFFMQIPCGRGSVQGPPVGRRDILCTSSFMDDVTFGPSRPYGDAWKAEPLTY